MSKSVASYGANISRDLTAAASVAASSITTGRNLLASLGGHSHSRSESLQVGEQFDTGRINIEELLRQRLSDTSSSQTLGVLKKQSTTPYQRKKQRSLMGPSRNLPRNYLFLQSASASVAAPSAATVTSSSIASVSAAAQRYYAKRPSVEKKERNNASTEL